MPLTLTHKAAFGRLSLWWGKFPWPARTMRIKEARLARGHPHLTPVTADL